MPTKIETPACVKEFMSRLYPDIDVDRITFHEGVPFYTFPGAAITIGPHIYFREERFDPCGCKGIALIAHELYHVHQGAAGFGFWFLRPYYFGYVWAWLTSGFKRGKEHPLEAPAYKLQRRVSDCCDSVREATGQAGPCICQDGRPTGISDAFLSAFAAECPDPLAGDD